MKRFTHNLLLLLPLIGIFIFIGCKEKEDIINESSLNCYVEYDFRLPAPLMEIAEAYVEYTDNGQKHTEIMKDGKWNKYFHYSWKGDAVNDIDYDINTLKIILKPKVSTDQLKNGAKLLNDPNSYFKTEVTSTYINKLATSSSDISGSSTTSSSSSSTYSDGGTYIINYDYGYSIDEQIKLFDSQDTHPLWENKCDHVGTKCMIAISRNFGLDQ